MPRLLNLLLALLLTVRSLLPVGFMLAVPQAGDGLITVVICTGHGTGTITLDRDGNPAPSKVPGGETILCPYAPTGAAALHADAPTAVEGEAYLTTVTYAAAEVPRPAARRLGGLSARGPPSALI